MKPGGKKRRSKKRMTGGYCGGWERNRMVKAKESKRNVKNVGKRIGKYLKARPEHKRLKTVIVSDIMVKRYGFSLRGTMSELRYGRDSRRTAGPQHVPPKSLPRKWPKRAPVDLPGGLIPFAAGKAAYGPFSADSTRRRFNRYVLAKHVKGGGADGRHAQAPRHGLSGRQGASLVATDGGCAGAAPFGKTCAEMSDGRCAASGGSAYRSPTNCEAAKGRDTYFEPKKNHPAMGPPPGPRWPGCGGPCPKSGNP